MAASLVYQDGTPANPGVKEFQIKSLGELDSLPTTKKKGTTGYFEIDDYAAAGSTCLCIEEGTVFFLDREDGWVEAD